MEPLNGYMQVKPIKDGFISSVEGNEYEVVARKGVFEKDCEQMFFNFEEGDLIIIEDNLVIRVNIQGEEAYFVREENVLARVPKDSRKQSESQPDTY